MRALTWLALALVVTIVLASALLRLSGSGVGCTPWPACYAAAAAQAPSAGAVLIGDDAAPLWHGAVRLAHRLSAATAGLLFIYIVVFGYARWSRSERIAGVALWVLAAVLAVIGRITPSELPAVVVANLLGGHLLLAALAWLLLQPRVRTSASPSIRVSNVWPAAAVALVLVQLLLGGLVSARLGVTACADGCSIAAADWSALPAALHLWRPLGALGIALDPMRQALLQAHSVGGIVLLLVAGAAAWRIARAAPARAAAAVPLVLVIGVLLAGVSGLGVVQQHMPLAAAAAHSLIAGLVLAASVGLWRVARAARAPR